MSVALVTSRSIAHSPRIQNMFVLVAALVSGLRRAAALRWMWKLMHRSPMLVKVLALPLVIAVYLMRICLVDSGSQQAYYRCKGLSG